MIDVVEGVGTIDDVVLKNSLTDLRILIRR